MSKKLEAISDQIIKIVKQNDTSMYCILLTHEDIEGTNDDFNCMIYEGTNGYICASIAPDGAKKDFTIDVFNRIIRLMEMDLLRYKKHLEQFKKNYASLVTVEKLIEDVNPFT